MKLVHLQVLRAFAALLVVVFHAEHEAAALAGRLGVAFAPSTLLPWPAGVDVFFVISGFIITTASGPLYRRAGGRRRFLAHRVARLVPLYWLVSLAYLAVALAWPGMLSADAGSSRLDPGYVVGSFLFWPVARPDGTPVPLYGLGWTLNCEMFFYALFALGLGWGRRAAVAWLATGLGSLVAARALMPAMPMPLAFWASPIVLEFVLGAVLGLARIEGLRLGSGSGAALAVAGLTLLALVPNADDTTRLVLWGGPAALLVAAAGCGREAARPGAGRSRLVRAAGALGDASYALYLVHPFVLRAGREAILRSGLGPVLGPWGALVLMTGLAVVASLIVFRVVERPLTRRARQVLDPGDGMPARRVGDEKALDGRCVHVPRGAERT